MNGKVNETKESIRKVLKERKEKGKKDGNGTIEARPQRTSNIGQEQETGKAQKRTGQRI